MICSEKDDKSLDFDRHIMMEINLAQYTIFDFSKKKKDGPYHKEFDQRYFLPDGRKFEIKFSISCPYGRPGILEFNIYTALLKLAFLQDTKRPCFKFSQILKEINYSPRKSTKVREAIELLYNVSLTFEKGFYEQDKKSYQVSRKDIRLIYEKEFCQEVKKGKTAGFLHSVTINPSIFANMKSNYFSLIDKLKYHSLNFDGSRRLIHILEAKKCLMGESFFLEIDYLGELLNISGKKHYLRKIKDYLNDIKTNMPYLDFELFSANRIIRIDFFSHDSVQNRSHASCPFWKKLLEYYPLSYLKKVGLNEHLILEFEKKAPYKETMVFQSFQIAKYQFFLDQILFQYFHITKSKELKNISAFLNAVMTDGGYLTPIGYQWIEDRIREQKIEAKNQELREKADEREKKKIEKERRIKLKRHRLIEKIMINDKEYYEVLKTEAIKNIKNRELLNPSDATFNLTINYFLDREILRLYRNGFAKTKSSDSPQSLKQSLKRHSLEKEAKAQGRT